MLILGAFMRALLFVPLLVLACSSESESAPSSPATDAEVGPDTSEAGITCCPIADIVDGPPCVCVAYGGSSSQPGGCSELCDVTPSDAVKGVDENGCPILRFGSESCFGSFDSGPPPDTTPKADAHTETETSEAGMECCPIADIPTCDCYATGGSKSQPGGCKNICDARPTAASKGVDENGCPIWNVGPGSCI